MKIGDNVSVLDEDLSGKITDLNSSEVIIITSEGFELAFHPSEVVVIDNSISKKDIQFHLHDVIAEKDFPKKKRKSPLKTGRKKEIPTMEIDLHIHKLVASEKGMTPFDKLNLQLETAKKQLDFAISRRFQKIVFIHGVGEGVLKTELETVLRRYDSIKFYDADYQKYGFGATEVYIYQNS